MIKLTAFPIVNSRGTSASITASVVLRNPVGMTKDLYQKTVSDRFGDCFAFYSSVSSGAYSRMSPGWQCSASQMAMSVENRIALI